MSRRNTLSNSNKITTKRIIYENAKSILSELNPLGPNRDPAKAVIRHPMGNSQMYHSEFHNGEKIQSPSVFIPIEYITMDECIKHPDLNARKYKPSECIKIIKYINETDKTSKIKTGVCSRHLTMDSCIKHAAKRLGIEDPNEYGNPNDLFIQLEGYQRERVKERQNESARLKAKSVSSKMKNTFKEMFSRYGKHKAGRRTRNRRRKLQK